jgi:cyclopropane-fatty-acyl-phospholipid synthase
VDNEWVGLGAGEFIERYVFPHGELPHLSLAIREMSVAGLDVADVECLRAHYALTLQHWTERLEHGRVQAKALVGDRRYRIWLLYLAGCAYGFEHNWMSIYQVLGCKASNTGRSPMPWTREYMYGSRAGTADKTPRPANPETLYTSPEAG